MKKLLIVVFLAGFVGLAFAFSPSKVVSSNEVNGISVLNDTTKTTKKTTTTTKKDCGTKTDCTTKSSKKSCCKSKTSDTPKKVN